MQAKIPTLRKVAIWICAGSWALIFGALVVPAASVVADRHKMVTPTANAMDAVLSAISHTTANGWFPWLAGGCLGLSTGFLLGVWLDAFLRRNQTIDDEDHFVGVPHKDGIFWTTPSTDYVIKPDILARSVQAHIIPTKLRSVEKLLAFWDNQLGSTIIGLGFMLRGHRDFSSEDILFRKSELVVFDKKLAQLHAEIKDDADVIAISSFIGGKDLISALDKLAYAFEASATHYTTDLDYALLKPHIEIAENCFSFVETLRYQTRQNLSSFRVSLRKRLLSLSH